MRGFFLLTFLLTLFCSTFTNACEADCQLGVATGISQLLFAQYADSLASIYTNLQNSLTSTTSASAAILTVKNSLTNLTNSAMPKFYPAIHNAIFKKYSGTCVDVGLLCGNPVAVYYGIDDVLTIAQDAANTLVQPDVQNIASTLQKDVSSDISSLDTQTQANINNAINSSVPTGGIQLKYVSDWIPAVQALVVQWP